MRLLVCLRKYRKRAPLRHRHSPSHLHHSRDDLGKSQQSTHHPGRCEDCSNANLQSEAPKKVKSRCLYPFDESDFPPVPLSVCLEAVEGVLRVAG